MKTRAEIKAWADHIRESYQRVGTSHYADGLLDALKWVLQSSPRKAKKAKKRC